MRPAPFDAQGRFLYRSSDRTLTDKEIDPVHQKVRAALEKRYQVSLRS
ncbi:MAG: hypothetical protein AAF810_21630 [Cyanobacteria bacterium P01_D01_bin.36]